MNWRYHIKDPTNIQFSEVFFSERMSSIRALKNSRQSASISHEARAKYKGEKTQEDSVNFIDVSPDPSLQKSTKSHEK